MKRKFRVEWMTGVSLEIDEQVFDAVTDEWRSVFYPLYSEEDIAIHLAANLGDGMYQLTQLDGWANLKDDFVRIDNQLDMWSEMAWEEDDEDSD